MEDKERKNNELLGLLLIISIIVNIYQFTKLNSTKKFEKDADRKKIYICFW